jgi:ankyrin repeat protein
VEERGDDRRDFFSRETDLQVWSDTSLLSRPESRPNSDFRQSTESLEDSQTDWNVQASFDYSNAIFPAPRNEENAFMRVRYVTQYMVPSRNWQNLDRNQKQDFSRNPLSHAAAQCDIKWAREILCNTGTDPNASDGESLTPLARICRDPKGDFEAVIKLLIKHGADVNAPSFTGSSWDAPLSIATGRGDIALVGLLLTLGVDANADGSLQTACRGGHVEIVRILLAAGADVNTISDRIGSSNSDSTPLQTACRGGQVEIVRLLLAAGAHLNFYSDRRVSATAGKETTTALQEACGGGHVDIVKILLAAGAHVNFYSDRRVSATAGKKTTTALQEACGGGHVDIVKILLAAGAYVNHGPTFRATLLGKGAQGYKNSVDGVVGSDGYWISKQYSRPLWIACEFGSTDLATMLIDAGADVNPDTGMIPLQAACAKGHLDIIRMLIACGADVNACHSKNGTPLQAACESRNMTSVKLLIDAGARVNDPSETPTRITALAAAIMPLDETREPGDEENVLALVRYLIEQGADVNGCSYWMTALQAAASTRQIRVLEELLRLGADVNQTPVFGRTALQAAIPNIKVMKLLLNHGADVNAMANANVHLRTALQIAAHLNHEGAVRLLIDSYGALVNAPGIRYTVLEASVGELKYNIEKEAEVEAVTAFLLQRSAECTPWALKPAVESGNLDVVKLLLEYGKVAYGKDCMVEALENAVDSSRLKVVAYLLGCSVKPTPTCAHIAAYYGRANILKMLLMHGAPVDKPAATVYGIGREITKGFFFWTGNTVLETALYHNKPKIVQFLQEWERDPQSAGTAQSSSEQGPVAFRIQEVE